MSIPRTQITYISSMLLMQEESFTQTAITATLLNRLPVCASLNIKKLTYSINDHVSLYSQNLHFLPSHLSLISNVSSIINILTLIFHFEWFSRLIFGELYSKMIYSICLGAMLS